MIGKGEQQLIYSNSDLYLETALSKHSQCDRNKLNRRRSGAITGEESTLPRVSNAWMRNE